MSKRREAICFYDGNVDKDTQTELQEHLVEEAQSKVIHARLVPAPVEPVFVDVRWPLAYAVLDRQYDPDERDEHTCEGNNQEIVGEEVCIVACLEEPVIESGIRSKLNTSAPIVNGFVERGPV